MRSYFQLWRRDRNDVKFAQDWISAWEKYGRVPLSELKAAEDQGRRLHREVRLRAARRAADRGAVSFGETPIDRPDAKK